MKMRRGKCRNCERLARRVAELEKQLAAALARIEDLERQLAAARKDSSTSSKPPSSDIVKPPRPLTKSRTRRRTKPRRGGQPGHPRHERSPFPAEKVDKIWIYEWPESSLTSDWKALEEFHTLQQVDLVPKLFEVTEHRARLYLHRPTGEVFAAPLPPAVTRAGLVGPRLPGVDKSQKHFNTGIVVIVEHGRTPSREILDGANAIARVWIDYWETTTGHRSTMTVKSR